VLGTAVGGIPYLLGTPGTALPEVDEPAGWVVRPDPVALAAALPVARAEAAALAKVARERYLRFFHPDVLTARLIDIYTELSAITEL
jgi:glycosyltransferase involved in cell wall biosynthesis